MGGEKRQSFFRPFLIHPYQGNKVAQGKVHRKGGRIQIHLINIYFLVEKLINYKRNFLKQVLYQLWCLLIENRNKGSKIIQLILNLMGFMGDEKRQSFFRPFLIHSYQGNKVAQRKVHRKGGLSQIHLINIYFLVEKLRK